MRKGFYYSLFYIFLPYRCLSGWKGLRGIKTMVTYRKQIAVKDGDKQIIKVPIEGEEPEMISATQAKWILRRYLRSRIFYSRKILLFDSQYELVDESKLNLKPVHLGGGDCDDKAWVLLAYVMMGQVIKQHPYALFGFTEGYNKRGLKHAWCFFLNEFGSVRYAEPSSAETFTPSVERVYHFIR